MQSYVNSIGQTTIPIRLRRLLGLEGETITWTLLPDGGVVVRPKYPDGTTRVKAPGLPLKSAPLFL